MTREELAQQAKDLTQAHHDAFLIELLGVEGSGLPDSRIDELLSLGLIGDEDFDSLASSMGMPPLVLLRVAGHILDKYPEQRDRLRELNVAQWIPLAQEWIDTAQPRDVQAVVSPIAMPPSPISGTVVQITPPPWMSIAEKASHVRAYTRAGEYVRGLGNKLNEDLDRVIGETWAGDSLEDTPLPEERERQIEIIRRETAQELATSRDAKRLAGTLGDSTGDYARNWQRIAVTELQASHNEGRIISAVEMAGEGRAYVARINNSDACIKCIELFRDEDGGHKVFSVMQLEANGTNVGKKRSEWLPTIFPVHPNCQCDTIPVPEGFRVDSTGRLYRKET